jgi:hypothetical protein
MASAICMRQRLALQNFSWKDQRKRRQIFRSLGASILLEDPKRERTLKFLSQTRIHGDIVLVRMGKEEEVFEVSDERSMAR